MAVTFLALTFGALTARADIDVRQVRLGGLVVSAVPEPMTALLFAAGLAGIAGKVRRRRDA